MNDEKEIKNIVVAIPHTGTLPTDVTMDLLNLKTGPYRVQFAPLKSSILFISREYLTKSALQSGADYILFLDSDQTFPEDLIIRMANWMDRGADILTTLIFRKDYPYNPCVFANSQRLESGQISLQYCDIEGLDLTQPFYVANCGLGCAMIRKEVFLKIPEPWFLPSPYTGEDIVFLHKATQDYGFKIICDPTIEIGHLGTKVYTRKDYFSAVNEQNKLLNGAVTPEVYL